MTPSPGTIVRKAAAILRTTRAHSSTGNARISKNPGNAPSGYAKYSSPDDKDIYSYTSGVLQNLEAVS
jgi:hypothetical protein